MTTTTVPGLCPCGEYASQPHACEHRQTASAMRLCQCGEYTYSSRCGNPCRLPDEEIPPMPATAVRWPVKDCGHLPGDECGCVEGAEFLAGVASYGRWRRSQ